MKQYKMLISSGRYKGKTGIGFINEESNQIGVYLNGEPYLTWFSPDKCALLERVK